MVRLAIAVFAAALVGALTRWPVGALLAGIAAHALPTALGSNKAAQRALARVLSASSAVTPCRMAG